MFYLKLFYKLFGKYPIKGFFFLIFYFSYLLVSSERSFFDNIILENLNFLQDDSYFYAIASSQENMEDIVKKMRSLPGVKRVEILSSQVLELESKELLQSFSDVIDTELAGEIFKEKYQGMKIVFISGLAPESATLVRTYFLRLVGEEFSSAGPIKLSQSTSEKGVLPFLKKNNKFLFLGLSFLFSFLCLFLCIKDFSQEAYLIEMFQRRKYVLFKTIFFGALSLSAIVLVCVVLMGHLNSYGLLYPLIFFIFIPIMTSKKLMERKV